MMQPEGAQIGLTVMPDGIHIMKKAEGAAEGGAQ
jgi:hypothetical protein